MLKQVGENLKFVHIRVGVFCVEFIDVLVIMELKLYKIKSFQEVQ
jgi:hypothetical protein